MTTPTQSPDSPSPSKPAKTDASNVVEMASAHSDPADAEDSESSSDAPVATSSEKKGSSKLTTLLGVLLFLSVGLNFWQSQNQANLEARGEETIVALERAVERIDVETLRANRAETTLSAIDRGVDKVNERILELQAALSELSQLTER